MNSIILNHTRSLLKNSLLKSTTYGRCAPQLAFFAYNAAQKPLIPHSCIMIQNNLIIKRAASDVAMKQFMANKSKDHSGMWVLERLFALASLTSFVAMFLHPCENQELFFALMVSVHAHYGVGAIMVDYLRPAVVGAKIAKLVPFMTAFISLFMCVFLSWIAVEGNGIGGSLQQLWYLDPTREPYDAAHSKLHPPVEE